MTSVQLWIVNLHTDKPVSGCLSNSKAVDLHYVKKVMNTKSCTYFSPSITLPFLFVLFLEGDRAIDKANLRQSQVQSSKNRGPITVLTMINDNHYIASVIVICFRENFIETQWNPIQFFIDMKEAPVRYMSCKLNKAGLHVGKVAWSQWFPLHCN